jgi:hypothetical protein
MARKSLDDIRREADRARRADGDLYAFIEQHPEAQYKIRELLEVLQRGQAADLEGAWAIVTERASAPGTRGSRRRPSSSRR